MTEKPQYLIDAETRLAEVCKNPDAKVGEILAAEDAYADAKKDAEADGYYAD